MSINSFKGIGNLSGGGRVGARFPSVRNSCLTPQESCPPPPHSSLYLSWWHCQILLSYLSIPLIRFLQQRIPEFPLDKVLVCPVLEVSRSKFSKLVLREILVVLWIIVILDLSLSSNPGSPGVQILRGTDRIKYTSRIFFFFLDVREYSFMELR